MEKTFDELEQIARKANILIRQAGEAKFATLSPMQILFVLRATEQPTPTDEAITCPDCGSYPEETHVCEHCGARWSPRPPADEIPPLCPDCGKRTVIMRPGSYECLNPDCDKTIGYLTSSAINDESFGK